MISAKSILVALVMIVAAASTARADNFDYTDILGTWCGSRDNPNWTNYEITRDDLIVTHLPAGSRTTLRIDHFEFSDSDIVIFYRSAGHGTQAGTPGNVLSRVQFIRFSADGLSMVQAVSDVSGEYRFRRCRG